VGLSVVLFNSLSHHCNTFVKRNYDEIGVINADASQGVPKPKNSVKTCIPKHFHSFTPAFGAVVVMLAGIAVDRWRVRNGWCARFYPTDNRKSFTAMIAGNRIITQLGKSVIQSQAIAIALCPNSC
jgi:hypothetical protein